MADDYCSIDLDTNDLDTPNLTKAQIESAERLANEIILENRPVDIRFVTRDEAGTLGFLRTDFPLPTATNCRIIDIRDWDLSACGRTTSHTPDRSPASY